MFTSEQHPVLAHHRGRHLFLCMSGQDRVYCKEASLFSRDEKMGDIASATLDQLPIPEERRGSLIQSVEWLLENRYLPQFVGQEVRFQLAVGQDENEPLLEALRREIYRISQIVIGGREHPSHLIDLRTDNLFHAPYIVQVSGHTYERDYIMGVWIHSDPAQRLCPITRQLITSEPTPNRALQDQIDQIRNESPIPLLPAMRGGHPGDQSALAAQHRQAAQSHLEQGNSQLAIQTLEHAFAAAEDYEHYNFLATIYHQTDELIKEALVYLQLARLQIQRGQFDEAFTNFDRALTFIPNPQESTQCAHGLIERMRENRERSSAIFRGLAREASGEKALSFWEEALASHPRAEGLFEEIIGAMAGQPKAQRTLFVTASLYFREDLERSRALRGQSIQLDPRGRVPLWGALLSLPGEESLDTIRTLRQRFLQTHYYFEAAARSREPEDVWVYVNFLMTRGKDQEAAYAVYSQWVQGLVPEVARAAVNRALTVFGRDSRILEQLLAQLQHEPSDHQTLRTITNELGNLYEENNDWANALRVYAGADEQIHDYETALKYGKAMGMLDPRDGVVYLSDRLSSLFISGNYEVAGRYIDLIRELAPPDALERLVDPSIVQRMGVQFATIDLFRRLQGFLPLTHSIEALSEKVEQLAARVTHIVESSQASFSNLSKGSKSQEKTIKDLTKKVTEVEKQAKSSQASFSNLSKGSKSQEKTIKDLTKKVTEVEKQAKILKASFSPLSKRPTPQKPVAVKGRVDSSSSESSSSSSSDSSDSDSD